MQDATTSLTSEYVSYFGHGRRVLYIINCTGILPLA